MAGVVGLELRNPLGLKSVGVAGGISATLAEMAQQRRFAFELRRYQRAAAARRSPHSCSSGTRFAVPLSIAAHSTSSLPQAKALKNRG